jgi:hypothetical protein
MIDSAHWRIAWMRNLRLLVFFREALFERIDALGDIAHDVRNLALAAKNDQHDGPDNEPMGGGSDSVFATLAFMLAKMTKLPSTTRKPPILRLTARTKLLIGSSPRIRPIKRGREGDQTLARFIPLRTPAAVRRELCCNRIGAITRE